MAVNVLGYTAYDLRRHALMISSMFFIVVLPTALFLMFGGLSDYSDDPVGHGNVSSYLMISMALYGAVTATTNIAGSAAVERSHGWGRQLALTALRGPQYVLSKVTVALVIAVLPVVVVYLAGALVGSKFDEPWLWLATGAIVVLGSAVFALYGLTIGQLFRSESAVGTASGILVVLAFFGNLFVPLSGVLLDIGRWTPLYGLVGLARWPQTEGVLVAANGPSTDSDELWQLLLNVGAWTVIFAIAAVYTARRGTRRQ
ncbi:ABC transporter permease [Microbacterium gorillae]|uniref:ABC transporter permease n=1 Tax=Microbacterium gorillae TaxID=1231063 RepID=UPI00058C2591|nr:ABC transporter permease [Microbacterium gorillae]